MVTGCDVAVAVAILVLIVVAALRGELIGGEWDPAEQFTGILTTARCIAAVLGGQAVVQNWHHKLGIPLQADDGKLTQGHIQTAGVPGYHQFLVKESADAAGDLVHTMVAAVAFATLAHLGGQDHGIQNLHH